MSLGARDSRRGSRLGVLDVVNKVSVHYVGRQRVQHEDLLEQVIAERREEVGPEHEGQARPSEIAGHKECFGGDAIETAIGLVVPSIHLILVLVVVVVSVMSVVVRVTRAVGEILGSTNLLQTRGGGREGGLAEEQALQHIGRKNQRVLDAMNQSIRGADVWLDHTTVEVKIDGRERKDALAGTNTPVGTVVVSMSLASVEPSSDGRVVGDGLGVERGVGADEVIESSSIDEVTDHFATVLLLLVVVVIVVVFVSVDTKVTLVVSNLLLHLAPLLNRSRTEGKVLVGFLLVVIVTTVVMPVKWSKEGEVVLLLEDVLGSVGRILEDVGELSKLVVRVDDVPDGLSFLLKRSGGGS